MVTAADMSCGLGIIDTEALLSMTDLGLWANFLKDTRSILNAGVNKSLAPLLKVVLDKFLMKYEVETFCSMCTNQTVQVNSNGTYPLNA